MKKIVSLVLCLALVLALGTVAFAADDPAYLAKDGKTYVVDFATNTDGVVIASGNVTTAAATQLKNEKGAVVSGTVAYSQIDTFKYVSANKEDKGAVVLYKDGKVVGYALELTATEYKYTGAEFTKFGTGCGEAALTQGSKDAKLKIYTIAGEDGYYKVGEGGKNTLVGNAVLSLVKVTAEDVTVKEHAFKYDTTAGKVTKVYCDNCKKSFEFTDSRTVATSFAQMAEKDFGGKTYYINLGAAAANAGTASNVTSAKTFDAGVAMYAGLALMSVAGSAVVIGKKKEF